MSELEEMKQTLIAAGYKFEHGRSEKEIWIWQAWAVSPDEWLYEAEAYIGSDLEQAQDNAINEAIQKAYQHLLKQRELAALRQFVSEVASMEYFSEDKPFGAQGNYSGTFNTPLMQVVEKAKALRKE